MPPDLDPMLPMRLPTCGDAGGRTQSGRPCRVYMNLGATGLCLMHDASRIEERRAVHAKGGVAKGVAVRQARAVLPEDCPKAPKTLADAERYASWLTHAVCIGTIDARTAHEAAVCLREFRGANEKRVLQAELKSLRADLAAMKGTAKRGRVA